MEPTIKLATKTGAFQFLWLKNVEGFSPHVHCIECLKGERSKIIPVRKTIYPEGFTAEGKIEKLAPYAYLCAVRPPALNDISLNVHILMERDDKLTFTYEDDNIRVSVTGMCRIKINSLPHEAEEILPEEFWRCRNYQAGWQLFPDARIPFDEVPGAKKNLCLIRNPQVEIIQCQSRQWKNSRKVLRK